MDSTCKGCLSIQADRCSAGGEDKGTLAGADGGPGICTASISRYLELLINTLIVEFYCLGNLHLGIQGIDYRGGYSKVVQHRRKQARLPLQKVVANLTNPCVT